MEFQNLSLINDALLGKQFWRLMEFPLSLVSKTLKAKYYKDTDVCSACLGCNPSFAWRGFGKRV